MLGNKLLKLLGKKDIKKSVFDNALWSFHFYRDSVKKV